MKSTSMIVLLFVLFVASNSNATPTYTGIYGLWALSDWDAGLQLLSDNKFSVTVDATDVGKLNTALSKKIKCIVPFGLTKEIAQDDLKWQKFLQQIRWTILNMKDHPAVMAWYPVDEPDGQGIPISKIKELTQFIRSIDRKPIFVVLNTPKKWNTYLPYFDIISVDPYLRRNLGVYDQTDVVKVWLKKVKNDMAKLKIRRPVWVVLGAFSLQPTDGSTPRYKKPSPIEFNEMVNYAITEGVDGIMVYTLALKETSIVQKWFLPVDDPDLWREVARVPIRVN